MSVEEKKERSQCLTFKERVHSTRRWSASSGRKNSPGWESKRERSPCLPLGSATVSLQTEHNNGGNGFGMNLLILLDWFTCLWILL